MQNEPSEATRNLREAWSLYRRRGAYDAAQLDEAVKALAQHKVWSVRAMAKILGASYNQIQGRVDKPERTGGRFEPATLELMLEEARLADLGEANPVLTARIVGMGTSATFLAKVLGQSPKKVEWRLKQAQRSDG